MRHSSNSFDSGESGSIEERLRDSRDELTQCAQSLYIQQFTYLPTYQPMTWSTKAGPSTENPPIFPTYIDEEKQASNRVLIEGEIGTGKTFWCQHLAKEWAQDNNQQWDWLEQFGLVLNINLPALQQFTNNDDVSDEILAQFTLQLPPGLQLTVPGPYEKSEVLLILDDYQAVQDSASPNFLKLLNRLFEFPNLIVTTRPGYYPDLAFDRTWTLQGFFNQQAQSEFVRQILYTLPSLNAQSPEARARNILHALTYNASLAKIGNNPHFLTVFCYAYSQSENPSNLMQNKFSLSDIYQFTLKSSLANYPDSSLTEATKEEIVTNLIYKLGLASYLAWQRDEFGLSDSLLNEAALSIDDKNFLQSIALLVPFFPFNPLEKKWQLPQAGFQHIAMAYYIANEIHSDPEQGEAFINELFIRHQSNHLNLLIVLTASLLMQHSEQNPTLKGFSKKIVRMAFEKSIHEGTISERAIDHHLFLLNEVEQSFSYTEAEKKVTFLQNGLKKPLGAGLWFTALENGYLNCLKMMKKGLTDKEWRRVVAYPNEHGNPSLHIALMHGRSALYEWIESTLPTESTHQLLKHKNKLGETGLHLAVNHADIQHVKWVLRQAGTQASQLINARDHRRMTPILSAAAQGQLGNCTTLLDTLHPAYQQTHLAIETPQGNTALMLAVEGGHTQTALYLFSQITLQDEREQQLSALESKFQAWFPSTVNVDFVKKAKVQRTLAALTSLAEEHKKEPNGSPKRNLFFLNVPKVRKSEIDRTGYTPSSSA